MKNLYPSLFIIIVGIFLCPYTAIGQACSSLSASFITYESRCAATGAIKVVVTGGSGNYKYKTTGPVNTNFTNTDSITGLSAGTYSVVINDVTTNCTFTQAGVVVPGSYSAPGFTLNEVDVRCDNGSNGSITAVGLSNGRSPFLFTIVAPSPSGVGSANGSGVFNGLPAGTYSIQLTDSCGGIQTRQITINNYTWSITGYQFSKTSCDTASGWIQVTDSKGNISTVGGLPGFSYGVVLAPGDTVWSASPAFSFLLPGTAPFGVVARDPCGNIKMVNASVSLVATVSDSVSIYHKSCATFDVSLLGITNFFHGNFCLFDSAGNQLQCDTSGTFAALPYGSYCIKAHDSCSDTTITRCFAAGPPVVSEDPAVQLSQKSCQFFTASITGQTNFTSPQYCLHDSAGALIVCNSTGVFDSLAYGSYCITTKDGCIDTTVTRCFVAVRPVPVVDSIIPSYSNCTNFGLRFHEDSIPSPVYCLYDSLGNLIQCDSTGIFDSIPLGNYCIHIFDPCLDTTIIRCFNVGAPAIANDMNVNLSNKTCTSFTASAFSHNLVNPYYCLYDSANVLISCDSSGVFTNLAYGNYCIQGRNSCPDTTFTVCFAASKPIPSVNGTVNISNNTCTMFTAKITGQHNLTNPQYCLYDSSGAQVSCNTSGIFNNLLYGSYCIKIVDSCFDTTITRCFVQAFIPLQVHVNANKSCSYGFSKLNVSITGGGFPVDIKVYTPGDTLVFEGAFTTSNFNIDSIPGPAGQIYTIVASDNCGNTDSTTVSATVSYLTHTPVVTQNCPGGTWANGSGNVLTSVVTNMGPLTVRIVEKDYVMQFPAITPNTVIGSNYTFNDLGPGTYVISNKVSGGCGIVYLDTVTVNPYQFPDLSRSSAYQCDVNGFSVGAVIANGVGPYSYEIIGSTPSTPSILAGPQSNPVFNINNGTNYTLIRLRAIDACGNASLADASILPLANNGIVITSDCFFQPTTLSVDSIYNSSYTWYKKTTVTDSTLIGTASSYFIPTVLPSDTGIYVCHIVVNSGCIVRTYQYDLQANCTTVLQATQWDLSGLYTDNQVVLHWQTAAGNNVKRFTIERRDDSGHFVPIGALENSAATGTHFQLIDVHPLPGPNFYRLSAQDMGNQISNSNVITIFAARQLPTVSIYPNPVYRMMNILFSNAPRHVYTISLFNSVDQLVSQLSYVNGASGLLQIPRSGTMGTGVYIVEIIDQDTHERFVQKVILQ